MVSYNRVLFHLLIKYAEHFPNSIYVNICEKKTESKGIWGHACLCIIIEHIKLRTL